MKKEEKREQKAARKKIEEVKQKISGMSVTPDAFAYIKLYQALQGLYFAGEYKLVCEVCDSFLDKQTGENNPKELTPEEIEEIEKEVSEMPAPPIYEKYMIDVDDKEKTITLAMEEASLKLTEREASILRNIIGSCLGCWDSWVR